MIYRGMSVLKNEENISNGVCMNVLISSGNLSLEKVITFNWLFFTIAAFKTKPHVKIARIIFVKQ